MLTTSRPRHRGYITSTEKDLTINGIWFLPENPSDQVVGTLKIYENGGIILELTGFFDKDQGNTDRTQSLNTDLGDYQLIKGFAKTGGEITLHNCKDIVRRTPFAGGTLHIYVSCETAYFDKSFDKEDEIKFGRYDLRFPYLREWLWQFGFKSEIETTRKWNLSFESPEEFICKFDGDIISIKTFGSYNDQLYKFSGEQISYFQFLLFKKLSLKEFNEKYLWPTQNFLSFVTDRPNWVDQISAKIDSTNKEENLGKIFHLFPSKRKNKEKNTHPRDFLFWLKKTDLTFQEIFQRWLAINNELNTVLDLYFGVLFTEGYYPKTRFLNLIQSCEVYHSIRFEYKVIPVEKHDERVKSMLSLTPKNLKSWVRQCLKYSNRKNLKDVLTELFDDFGLVLGTYVSSIDKLTTKLKDTRNYYTHYNERLRNKAAQGEELVLLTELVSLILKFHLLKELGFSNNHISTFNDENSEWSLLRQQFQKKDFEYTQS